MALVTFCSDFGYRDHYVAAVKAKMHVLNKAIPVLDISHEVEAFSIPHAAFVMQSVFRDFPIGSVHLVSVGLPSHKRSRLIVYKVEEHFFVGYDNGLFSLLSDKSPAVIEIFKEDETGGAFPEKSVLAPTAIALASGASMYSLGNQIQDWSRLNHRLVKQGHNQLTGQVIHIDRYGNLITNISRQLFEETGKNRRFEVQISRFHTNTLAQGYLAPSEGELVFLFNSSDNLEIASQRGPANVLLSVQWDAPVFVQFFED